MVKCKICKKELKRMAFIKGNVVCQKCFLRERKGKRIYKVEKAQEFMDLNDELIEEIHKLRGRLANKGHSERFIIKNE